MAFIIESGKIHKVRSKGCMVRTNSYKEREQAQENRFKGKRPKIKGTS